MLKNWSDLLISLLRTLGLFRVWGPEPQPSLVHNTTNAKLVPEVVSAAKPYSEVARFSQYSVNFEQKNKEFNALNFIYSINYINLLSYMQNKKK